MTANKNRYIGGAKRTSNTHAELIEKAEIVLDLLKHYMFTEQRARDLQERAGRVFNRKSKMYMYEMLINIKTV